ncbi:MAG: enoyl-CoA hydratase/isomerase family protein [Gammaproteobacteria bacterium]|nr:enoyl-CoA hydratase/isomerase family protein [Gammaproteobacteria bacterium]MBT8110673.1 enoyl-CoA hydratase/isomerase family protein [Gammaproteobacteria bacterium]NND48528.1 enoyl-CoA hydratase [Woeseiaceae bacterium]NNL45372.1 enoyl-CoA hydratase [Woeseiaceae bacterium]
MTEIVSYKQHGAVAVITLNRPDALNAFTAELSLQAQLALERGADDDDVRVIVLTGEGRSFSAGADLKAGFEGRSVFGKLHYEYRPVFSAIATMSKPVIAAVPGSAAGIGMSLALHCDLLVMAENAFLLSPFTTISLVPDGGLSWLLVRQLGYRRAFQLSVESERIAANRCVELGLANKAVPAEDLQSVALEWAQMLAKRAPRSLEATKKTMRHAIDNDWASTWNLEADWQHALAGSEDNIEGVSAFFEKREPNFKGK